MSLISTPPAPRASSHGRTPPGAGGGRDAAVDLIRAACLVAVVVVHALMVGVSVQGGEPVLENALEPWDGFTSFSWFAQMMPLFFIAGGFAAATHYKRLRLRGVTAAGYVASRMGRLLPIPLLAAGATAAILAALALLGVDPTIVATAGWRISQPLWFLGVYVLCSALVPAMVAMHDRAPRATLVALGAAILTVDGLRLVTGVEPIGFANLLFVWLFVQQLGLWLADGAAPGARTAVVALAGGATWIAIGASPANLFEALNPPTAVLALLGVAQYAVFAALRPWLTLLADVPAVRRAADAINLRAMTIYSWHMPATVLLAGGVLVATQLLGGQLPLPLSDAWWLSRPAWFVGVAGVVAVTVVVAGRLERRALARVRIVTRPTPLRAAAAALVAAAGVLVILAGAGALAAWLCGAALLAGALLLCSDRGQKANAAPSSTP
ncbi:acyltransferase family protein [Leucobacter komagatae]|uniref:acyltransferase family protein n=1 Tax=Leucobacter komagatae TaxID=55969 RepID=UPI0006971CD3|nr:acyltransferase [Leucobacter komagatae]